jgi:hypothetical protein
MTLKQILALSTAAIVVAGCESGDIAIQPETNVTDSNNTINEGGGGEDNPCAAYVNTAGQTIQGTYDGTNCSYSPSFVDAGNNLRFDMTVPALPDGGAHIFQGSLFVGENYTSDAEMQAAGVAEGGDGPVLTVEAGATLAWQSNANFMIINRGSQIFAVGTPDAPITFTSVSDVDGSAGPEDVQQWGGMVINGFGVTNKCAYSGSVATDDLALVGECHVAAEGAAGLDESHYGGDSNIDSSGRLEYVIVKHTGAEVANGDEINGISFGGVGSNTIVSNLQTYSTYDDGIEMFGGAVNIENFVAVYVRDDSIDIDEGYSGTITNALVIQSATDGNHCIESDGIGSYGDLGAAARQGIINQGINSRPTINNLTCIISPNGQDTAQHDPGAGWLLREGIFATINDALLITSFSANDTAAADDNYCLSIPHAEGQQGALDGDWSLNSVIFACAERTAPGETFPDGTTTTESYATGAGNIFATIPDGTAVDPTTNNNPELQLLEGSPPIYSIAYATMQVDGAAPAGAPQSGTFIGALSLGETDWTVPWAYGIHPDNRGQDLWFE